MLVLDEAEKHGSAVPVIPRNITPAPLQPKGPKSQSGRERARDHSTQLLNRLPLNFLAPMSDPSAA